MPPLHTGRKPVYVCIIVCSLWACYVYLQGFFHSPPSSMHASQRASTFLLPGGRRRRREWREAAGRLRGKGGGSHFPKAGSLKHVLWALFMFSLPYHFCIKHQAVCGSRRENVSKASRSPFSLPWASYHSTPSRRTPGLSSLKGK